jgi:hypothetical protein
MLQLLLAIATALLVGAYDGAHAGERTEVRGANVCDLRLTSPDLRPGGGPRSAPDTPVLTVPSPDSALAPRCEAPAAPTSPDPARTPPDVRPPRGPPQG